MATKKKAAPLVKLPKETLVRRVLFLEGKSESAHKIADKYIQRVRQLELQIDALAKTLFFEFGDLQGESACEMAARLLREQRDKIAKLEAERQPRMYRTIPSDLPYNRSEPITNADSASAQRFTREVGR